MNVIRILVPVALLGLWTAASNAQTSDTAVPPATLPSADAISAAPADASPLDTPIEKIADMTGGCTILDKDFPGLRAHPMYPYFKAMTLNQIAAMSKGKITPDMLAQAKTDLTTLQSAQSDAPAATTPAALTLGTAPSPASSTVAAVH